MATKKTKPDTPEQTRQKQDMEQTPESASELKETSAEAARSVSDDTSGNGPADRSGPATREEGPAAPENALKNLNELALSFRVPTWQQAALLRLMGWTEDKSVSEAAYADALDALNSRRMGGGRKE